MRDTNHDVARIAGRVVDAIGQGDAFRVTEKVRFQHLQGTLTPRPPRILEVAYQLALLGIHRNDGVSSLLKGPSPACDVAHLSITAGIGGLSSAASDSRARHTLSLSTGGAPCSVQRATPSSPTRDSRRESSCASISFRSWDRRRSHLPTTDPEPSRSAAVFFNTFPARARLANPWGLRRAPRMLQFQPPTDDRVATQARDFDQALDSAPPPLEG